MQNQVLVIHDSLLAGLQQLRQHTDAAAARDARLEAKVGTLSTQLSNLQQQLTAQGVTVPFDDVQAALKAVDDEVQGIAPEAQPGDDSTSGQDSGAGTAGGTGTGTQAETPASGGDSTGGGTGTATATEEP